MTPDSDDDLDLETGLVLMLDTNCINARQGNASLNQLEVWHEEERIELLMCETSHQESYADGNDARRRKAIGHMFSISHAETREERWQLQAVEQAVFPSGATTPGQKSDVDIVFNAMKYANVLVTMDGGSRRQPGGILGAAQQLHKQHGLWVLTPEEAVAFVQSRINMLQGG